MLDKHTKDLLTQLIPDETQLHDTDISIETSRIGARALFLGLAGETRQDCFSKSLSISGSLGKVPVRLYIPKNKSALLPVIMFIHGGGWSLADLDCYDGLMRDLCALSGCAFLSVEYRLAPEHKFPAGLTDCCDAYSWIAEHAQKYRLNSNSIALMGDSAGGNLALVCAQVLAKQNALIKHLYLIYPVVDSASSHDTYPSRIQYGNGDFFLTREAISDTLDWYVHNLEEASNPLVSPLLADDFSQLPETSITLAGCDPLYDEGRLLAEKLKASGVLCRCNYYEQTIHAFLSFGVLPVAQEARKTLAQQVSVDMLSGAKT